MKSETETGKTEATLKKLKESFPRKEESIDVIIDQITGKKPFSL